MGTANQRVVPMTFGSLFAGIGGLDLGLERAGMVCKWQVEIDPFCQEVLAKHWPNVKRYGDITKINGSELEPVELICGGFPCQDVSNSGKREGITGRRSGLWQEYVRLIRCLRPRFVLVENVAGLLSRGMERVLGDLAEIGYDSEWQSFPAAAVGAPHLRNRVWILAYPGFELGKDEWRSYDGDGRSLVFPQSNDGKEAEWHEHRNLIAMVPGVHQRMATDWWFSQSSVGRTVNGLPRQLVDARNAALGNAVVPQVAEWIGQRILMCLSTLESEERTA